MNKQTFGKIHPATAAAWAAVVAAGYLLPTIPIFGTGRTFSLASALLPLSGMLFGPAAGMLCSAVAGFIGSLIAPHTAWMGMGTFIIGAAAAFTAGCIAWGSRTPVKLSGNGSFIINGGIIVYVTGTILWYTQEVGRSLVIFPLVCYGPGLIALLTGSIFARKMFTSKKKIMKFSIIWLSAFGGLLGGATVGNFFSIVLYKLPRDLWSVLMFITPLERAVFSLGSTLIGVPLIAGLAQIGIFTGPEQDEV
jgi:uncharacterized membrane protein